jgi:hypothetical protein
MNLRFHLEIIGILQILLALTHIGFSRRFGWREETARLSLLNRQIFYVHTFFICVVLGLFGLLNLAYAEELLKPGALAKAVLLGITLFWTARWFVQFFVYDTRLWKGNRFNTMMHVAFSAMWTYFVCVYGLTWWRQFNNQ